jgi:hypothetical protein
MKPIKKQYRAYTRAVRVRDRYYHLMEAADGDRERRYAADLWRLYVRKCDYHAGILGDDVRLHVETLHRQETDRYYDWLWVNDYLPLYRSVDLLRRSGAHQRDLWTRKHPMPYND